MKRVFLSRPSGSPWTRKSGPPAGTNAPRAGTSSSTQPARSASATSAVGSDHRDDTGFRRQRCAGPPRQSQAAPAWVQAVDELPRIVADQLDQGGDAQRLADVMHVHDQRGDAREHEDVRRRHGDPGTCPVPSPLSRTSRMVSTAWTTSRRRVRSRAGWACRGGSAARSGVELPHRQLARRPS